MDYQNELKKLAELASEDNPLACHLPYYLERVVDMAHRCDALR